jgi:hypothetical protein
VVFVNLRASFRRYYNKDGYKKSIPSGWRKPPVIRGYTSLPNAIAYDQRLSSDARFVYWLLRVHDRPGKELCWPGQQRLAEIAGWQTKSGQWDRRRVQRALDELESAYLIRRERRGGRRTNLYRLLPPPEELLITDDSEMTTPPMMRKSDPKTHQEAASDLGASDAHSSEADFQHKQEGDLCINGHQEIADENGNSPQSSHPFCAQRISSSRGCGGVLLPQPGEQIKKIEPQCGEKLNDERWRCLACGWTGLAVELLPRRFEGNSFLSFLCPNCRKLEGVAVEAAASSTTTESVGVLMSNAVP